MHLTTLKTQISTLIILFITIAPIYSFAQKVDEDNSNEIKTLFGDDITHGGYGALMFGYTPIANRNAMTAGAKGAWIINHGIGIGFTGMGYISEIETGVLPNEEWSTYTGGHGGLLIEPIIFGTQPIHVSIPLIIGGGAIFYGSDALYDYDNHPDYPDFYKSFFDYYFVFEPGIEIEFNLTHFFRLAAGVSYRLTSDVNLTRTIDDKEYQILNSADLRNFNVHLAFKFGKF